jgi:hypothetical protein
MNWLKDFKLLRLIPLAVFFLALPALAQFEVAPDHFDSSGTIESTRKQVPKNKATLAQPATSNSVSRTTAKAVAKVGPKGNRASNAHPTAGQFNVKTNGPRTSKVDQSRSVHGKRRTGNSVATVTPTAPVPRRE